MNSLFLFAAIALMAGAAIGYLVRKVQVKAKIDSAENRAEKLLDEVRQKEKEIILSAKDQAIKITEEAKKQETEIRQQILRIESRLEKKENDIDAKSADMDKQRLTLEKQKEELQKIREELLANRDKQISELEKVAKLTTAEAKTVLLEQTERQVKDDMIGLTRKIVEEAREEAEKKARDIVSQAIERVSAEVSSETTTTTVTIPSDEMKGRIIGKEGRNIKAFEQALGVEVIVDESPDTVVISGFNSVRRYVAKVTLEKLIQDGRIHPAKIEEAYEKAKKEVGQMIKEAGEQAVYELGITAFPPKLIQLIGRLKFRTSYGQNVLMHSVEMAKMGAIMAEELGADPMIVKQGALLHDIGKALDQEMEGTHVELGVQIAKKFNLPEIIVNCIAAHHGDVPHGSIEAALVDACDNISGARPGARRDSYEQYVKRLEELENLTNSFTGVEKSYAIQAGREIRVFVEPNKMDDWAAMKLAREIANKIEQQLKYPGEIKVQVIREMRVVEYAR
ncbi:MAG: ribonuclease Y [Candidatus Doudnabacteria bacterium RIFCSPHIGHO2_02_FULL_48_21]|nr:MAG: ribonuclease Y [Candidatus Doudnabacteria bacterium RIFCSPHIGHO2_01_48_18]OGE78352.1 MAG: ribonuclease Y [Candidatus Doudnabacteria bacterium RIFCSPHIGHO2_01_FULL_48_180]OGE91723.1 MAG: ribonuclease Y [Candidatus Doudnabacteria bacterium RIFCSPHIGHO2_12_FULL_47_25]OGE93385.1 MAG: ribonuclease Y [Candidatus Doudnabacteria bacterium RIFCSPHIGHO2_02_FULL_48_21]OGE97589.1 MAG: ribonuclease Y [Candidatus Doudnabacteria bacterium RIFCSPLOWO2_01_FULL_48_57]OGF02180.1 MAG: ribonuclease Y [Cand